MRGHSGMCAGAVEARVVYDKETKTYRGRRSCGCGVTIEIVAKLAHANYPDAEVDAEALQLPPPRPKRVRRPTKPKHPPALPPEWSTTPPPPVSPAELHQTWIGYWRTLATRNGWESRL